MVIAFQIVLLLVLVVSLIGVVGEKENNNLRNNLTALCIASVVAFIVSVAWL